MNNNHFSWIQFYKEVAGTLLAYKTDRANLLSWIYQSLDSRFTSYLHEASGDLLSDIDPFTVLGIFNRKIKAENRIEIAKQFKDFLQITAETPKDFDGIPVLNPLNSFFFAFEDKRNDYDIKNLWELFEQVLNNKPKIETAFDLVRKQPQINIKITMGLYWISPERFIALDRNNRNYLAQYGLNIPPKLPTYSNYMKIIEEIRQKMNDGKITEKSFPEISHNAAWGAENNVVEYESDNESWYDEILGVWKYKKNIILQGAPGTGKTYEIPELVVRLCNCTLQHADREYVIQAYKQLVEEKKVIFTTFHQSMDYEDFIEGLKPDVSDGSVNYIVNDGLFKSLCERAQASSTQDLNWGIRPNPVVWKVSLKATYDNPVRTDCLKNNRIRIGWDEYGELISEDTNFKDGGRIVLDAFINQMQVGDIVMSCYSNRLIDAIGVITSDYKWDDTLPEYKRVRYIKWLVKDIKEDIFDLNNQKLMTLSTVYRLNSIALDDVLNILTKHDVKPHSEEKKDEDPYILVIDEINRGNVSKIFGELITLLEADKRAGEESEIKVRLPYSKSGFKVPNNVFIIGTMNTADRSLGGLDYAIRRRFAFISMYPISLEGDDIPGFNEELFRKVSELFVSNYDAVMQDYHVRPKPSDYLSEEFDPADVWIGQSYFIMQDKNGIDQTFNRLQYEIIPILREYIRDGVFKNTETIEQTITKLENGDYDD